MTKKNRLILIFFTSYFLLLTSLLPVEAQETPNNTNDFNPNYIISDFEVLAYDSMDLQFIQEFLTSKGGYLASYKTNACTDDDVLNKRECSGQIMSAAEIIYDRAAINKVSPKFIIVLLQKEQSLIEDKNPLQSQLDWACGYGCPDGDSCNLSWKGFWKQVNSASLQFRDYMDNPHLYTYKAGQTYTFTNPYATSDKPAATAVTPANQATAALYNYTPHVYNGNYNFYKIWQRYFSRPVFPDGSLLQAEGEAGVWLIQDGKKRPFISKGALTSRYDINKIIIVSKNDLDKYEKGAPIKFPQYSLIMSPRGTVYLLIDDKRRGFASGEAFKKMGFQRDEVTKASWDDINIYQEIAPITATSTYPTGALLQDKKTGGVYWVMVGEKAPLLDPIFLKTKFKNRKIIQVKQAELDGYKTVGPVLFGDGELLKTDISPYVYLISGGKKRLIPSDQIFNSLGYKTSNVIIVPSKILYLYEAGEPITEKK
jgi:hypothetical protein